MKIYLHITLESKDEPLVSIPTISSNASNQHDRNFTFEIVENK